MPQEAKRYYPQEQVGEFYVVFAPHCKIYRKIPDKGIYASVNGVYPLRIEDATDYERTEDEDY